MSDPLWSDNIIHDEVVLRVREQKYWASAIKVATNMRDEYEAALTNQYQRIERLVELVDQLEAQLAAARPSSEVSDTITRSLVSSESINDTYTWMRRVDAATKWINVLRGKE